MLKWKVVVPFNCSKFSTKGRKELMLQRLTLPVRHSSGMERRGLLKASKGKFKLVLTVCTLPGGGACPFPNLHVVMGTLGSCSWREGVCREAGAFPR